MQVESSTITRNWLVQGGAVSLETAMLRMSKHQKIQKKKLKAWLIHTCRSSFCAVKNNLKKLIIGVAGQVSQKSHSQMKICMKEV